MRPLNPTARALRDWFGLAYAASHVAEALFKADTTPLTRPEISARARLSPAAVFAGLVQFMAALEPGELITDGRRYALTEAGCADCRRALSDAKAWRAAA